ncbi:hypothetical protein BZG36_05580 [Bifiguratus adelaidae]|uniref:Autophagy-related protein 101 n=1 Tax=Bifiguratus adelaidae TaxID=1938954 RepID=A0A261XT28_9FUNG|nr:hypothetical protein BZG36_05580 [Bifiguratus adelaidae]
MVSPEVFTLELASISTPSRLDIWLTQPQTVDYPSIPDVLSALLHTILFHRYLATVHAKDHHVLGGAIVISTVNVPEVERVVNARIGQFMELLDASAPVSNTSTLSAHTPIRKQANLAILFYEKRSKKAWFGRVEEEEVCWEQWQLTIKTVVDATTVSGVASGHTSPPPASTIKTVNSTLMQILKIVGERKDHIPPILSAEGNPFPFQIVIPSTPTTPWPSVLKQWLTHPPTSDSTAGIGTSAGTHGQYDRGPP